jgi:hypothetical protein
LEFLNFQYILKLQNLLILVKWEMKKMPNKCPIRRWLVLWLYAVAAGHLIGACVMTWVPDLPLLGTYHQGVLASFGFSPESLPPKALQLWWMALFGATLQAFSLFLLGLIYCADRHRMAGIWLFLAVILLWWAPQDIYISLQKNAWSHLWVDLAALVVLLPPLIALAIIDRRTTH